MKQLVNKRIALLEYAPKDFAYAGGMLPVAPGSSGAERKSKNQSVRYGIR